MIVSASQATGGSVEELGQLYAQLGQRLKRVVRAGVRAPDAVVEDACQVAWSRLLRYRERVRAETALGWLSATATHEALKLVGDEAREASLEHELEQRGEGAIGGLVPGPEDQLQARERLDCLAGLSARQQRLLWLQAIGLSYEEMARHERCTLRTVQRQLLRARSAARGL